MIKKYNEEQLENKKTHVQKGKWIIQVQIKKIHRGEANKLFIIQINRLDFDEGKKNYEINTDSFYNKNILF